MKRQKKQTDREEGLKGFLNLCLQFENVEDLEQLFDLFLTLEEKKSLEGRYLVIKALEEGKLTQRDIADKYNVSISQITRGSNALKIIDDSLKDTIKKHIN